jgi:CheY-like chemotaxis protein
LPKFWSKRWNNSLLLLFTFCPNLLTFPHSLAFRITLGKALVFSSYLVHKNGHVWNGSKRSAMSKLIAIIDDEQEMEYIYDLLFEEAIAQELIQIKYFTDSRIFLEWIRNNLPDLILCDINMPHFSGPELAERIRLLEKNIPLYFVSGYEEKDYSQIMKELGICRFLAKPLDLNKVHELIELDLGLTIA